MGNITKSDLKDRTKAFALRIMKLVGALPNDTVGRVIGKQLVRCGTSVGANYRSACRARSHADFVSKLGIVLEEADESEFWLELIIEGELMDEKRVTPLLEESTELVAIFSSSLCTSKHKPSKFPTS